MNALRHGVQRVLPLLGSLIAATASAQFVPQGTELVLPPGVGVEFGGSLSISESGDLALVGENSGAGAVWVVSRVPGGWDIGSTPLPFPSGSIVLYSAVALSADATTAVVGGREHDSQQGAAWIFSRSAMGVWTFGEKLTRPPGGDQVNFGRSVGISGDGSRVIVGATADNIPVTEPYQRGGAWVFVHSGGSWDVEGLPLIAPDGDDNSSQGWSVAISQDGSTAIVGGVLDGVDRGAAWIYSRSGATWSAQQKLTGVKDNVWFGTSVALSADGNTALVGTPYEGDYGAARLFKRSMGAWNAPGQALVTPEKPAGMSFGSQGVYVALSGDGKTALVGEPNMNDLKWQGRAWLYTPDCFGAWPATGQELTGAQPGEPPDGGGQQGFAVALAGDGNTALSGALTDEGSAGAVWAFERDLDAWVQIIRPCPDRFYFHGEKYRFSAKVLCNPTAASPSFKWSFVPSSTVGSLSTPPNLQGVVVAMKPGMFVGTPPPFVPVRLCVDVTLGGQTIRKCTTVNVELHSLSRDLEQAWARYVRRCPPFEFLPPARLMDIPIPHETPTRPWDPLLGPRRRSGQISQRELARFDSALTVIQRNVRQLRSEESRRRTRQESKPTKR